MSSSFPHLPGTVCLNEGHFTGMDVVHGTHQSDFALIDHAS
jgi:hypothetical protein